MEHRYQFRTQLRLQQHLHRYSSKILCLHKKLSRFRRLQEVEEEEVEEVEEVEEEEVGVELLEKIVSIDQLLLHKCKLQVAKHQLLLHSKQRLLAIR